MEPFNAQSIGPYERIHLYTLILCLVLVQPWKTRPDMSEKIMTGT